MKVYEENQTEVLNILNKIFRNQRLHKAEIMHAILSKSYEYLYEF